MTQTLVKWPLKGPSSLYEFIHVYALCVLECYVFGWMVSDWQCISG